MSVSEGDGIEETLQRPFLALSDYNILTANKFFAFCNLLTFLRDLHQESGDGILATEFCQSDFYVTFRGNPFFENFRPLVKNHVFAGDEVGDQGHGATAVAAAPPYPISIPPKGADGNPPHGISQKQEPSSALSSLSRALLSSGFLIPALSRVSSGVSWRYLTP